MLYQGRLVTYAYGVDIMVDVAVTVRPSVSRGGSFWSKARKRAYKGGKWSGVIYEGCATAAGQGAQTHGAGHHDPDTRRISDGRVRIAVPEPLAPKRPVSLPGWAMCTT